MLLVGLVVSFVVILLLLVFSKRCKVKIVYVHGRNAPFSIGDVHANRRPKKSNSPPLFQVRNGVSFGCSMYIDSIKAVTQGHEVDVLALVSTKSPEITHTIARVWMDGVKNDVHVRAGNAHATLTNIPLRTWMRLSVVYQPHKVLEVFFDGKLIATVPDSRTPEVEIRDQVPFRVEVDKRTSNFALLRQVYYANRVLSYESIRALDNTHA